jgi:phosphoribosylformylglycinamidine synthase
VAILREQGCNSHVEMAHAFDAAGFEAVDVHMTDLHAGLDLAGFRGLVAVGGFSYGDVLGAGQGWAKSVLYGAAARAALTAFFARPDTFAPRRVQRLPDDGGAARAHPRRRRRAGRASCATAPSSSRRGARWSRCAPSPSIFFRELVGARLPIVVSHGEGRAAERRARRPRRAGRRRARGLRFVDGHGRPPSRYPHNPNGSPGRHHRRDHAPTAA